MLYKKLSDIRYALERTVDAESLIYAAFRDCPNVKEFSYSYTQEYDDNNYSDYEVLNSVNGHRVDYEGNYDEEDDGESELPRVSMREIEVFQNLVQDIAKHHERGEDMVVERDNHNRSHSYCPDESMNTYLRSFLFKEKISTDFFVENEAKFALYYADDHGRFSEEDEFRIFAQQGRMFTAFEYAKHIIKGQLPEKVENFFILNGNEDDKESLAEYIEYKKGETCLNSK